MPQEKQELKEILRIILGALRPEMRELAREVVNVLPESTRKEWVGRLVGSLAKIVEKKDIFGIQKILSYAIEIISDEIGKTIKKPEEETEIDKMIGIKEKLKEIQERLKRAENVEEEKTKIIEELKAYKEILEIIKQITTEKIPEEQRKEIDWEKIFNKIQELARITQEKGIEGLKTAMEKLKEIDQKAGELADIIERKRREIRGERRRGQGPR